MHICVLNGSPKGAYSVTLQTVLYLEGQFPEHTFQVIHAAQRIKAIEKDLTPVLEALEKADLVLFSYPVYTFMVPCQLHRLVELLKASGVNLRGKPMTQLTTSKHFYDITAHRFMEENAHDMGMCVMHGLSADMDDLLTPKGQAEATAFFRYVLHCMAQGIYEAPIPRPAPLPTYAPVLPLSPRKAGKDVVIVTNQAAEDKALGSMIADFRAVFPYGTRIVNIAEYPFDGGCLSCFHCAGDGKCIYRDGFDAFLREKIQTADAIVFAFTLRDHSMGADFKRYDDRQFCNGHRTVTMGMPVGYIVRGDMRQESNLRMVIEGRCEVGQNFLCGIGTDADTLRVMADRLTYAVENKYTQPANFLGVGGMKIFRDLIWLMQGMMRADHRFYKAHGLYDFPQKQRSTIFKMKLVGTLMNNPKLQGKLGNKMNEGMIAPYKKALAQAAVARVSPGSSREQTE